jgi:hypothetical protein
MGEMKGVVKKFMDKLRSTSSDGCPAFPTGGDLVYRQYFRDCQSVIPGRGCNFDFLCNMVWWSLYIYSTVLFISIQSDMSPALTPFSLFQDVVHEIEKYNAITCATQWLYVV